ncbi:DUF4905 domain-containing protein [Telluribacter sp. SYSU D00476]|uniref:DUF4905 domain-containing protein n=1 Tax=Telluribacter sp. SYSU D00476 TaxID=2811430 RepID=UPI001FF42F50|nr:DUF4905 domain-containing protein [Telluribacter sp. SYSU D00476]
MTEQFSHVFPYAIWRIVPHPSPQRDEWAVELRDTQHKETAFALVDLAAAELRWQVKPEGTDWWTTLTAFAGERVLLHNYRFPDMPEPTDLLAVSTGEGLLSWAVPNHVFVRALDDTYLLIATRQNDSVRYKQCNLHTGQLLPYQEEEKMDTADQPNYQVPVRYRPRDVYFSTLSSFLDKTVNVKEPVVVDYLEVNPYIVFSYYIYEKEKIAQYVLIVNRQREVLYHQRLTEGREGVGRDTMFLKGSTLVFLRNNNELVSLKLKP